ncbi:MAG: putative nucleotidyltransferase [Flavobacteriaceae bacterium]|jgi:predicted nucleotidyltransferase
MKETIEIKETGSYFDVDVDGYIVNPASHEKIQDKWKPAIKSIINLYKNEFGDNLKNVYIRGSFAKGTAIENISDLDTFAYVYLEKEDFPKEWTEEFKKKFHKEHPFINGVDIMIKPVSIEPQGMILLNQSLCVFGEKSNVSKIKIGRDLILHAPNLQKRFNMFYEFKENKKHEAIEECEWQMKGILRTSLEILIEKSGKYSRDLYPCYKLFSENYPDKETQMRKVLHLALNPTDDIQEIEDVITGIGSWLIKEIKHVLDIQQSQAITIRE